jgi:hypothetical protein
MATRKQLLQPSLDRPTGPRRKTRPIASPNDRHRPYWPDKTWYHAFCTLATSTVHFPASRDLFFPGKLGKRAGVGPPAWSIVAFRLAPPHGSTPGAEP